MWSFRLRNLNDRLAIAEFVSEHRPARLSRNYERQEDKSELSGLQIWPRSAWSVVQLIGANCAFVANPARFLIVMLALLQWKERNDAVKLSSEGPFESFVTPVRYVRHAPRLQIVLA